MARRRMFSLDVVDTDKFLNLPVTARLLYYDLGMRADDDGVVAAPQSIVRNIGCTNSDLDILYKEGYVIPFDVGIIVIKDWKVNNEIRKDRYKPTIHRNEFKQLVLKNGAYVFYENASTDSVKADLMTDSTTKLVYQDDNQTGIPKVATNLDTQVRLGKDSIDYNINIIVEYLNEKAGTRYRTGTAKTKSFIKARLKEGFSVDDFKTVIDLKVKQWMNTDMAKYIRPETLFGGKFESYVNESNLPMPNNNNTKSPNRFNNFHQRDYNVDDLESQLLSTVTQ